MIMDRRKTVRESNRGDSTNQRTVFTQGYIKKPLRTLTLE
jgi:hypothetical protein